MSNISSRCAGDSNSAATRTEPIWWRFSVPVETMLREKRSNRKMLTTALFLEMVRTETLRGESWRSRPMSSVQLCDARHAIRQLYQQTHTNAGCELSTFAGLTASSQRMITKGAVSSCCGACTVSSN